MCNWIQFPESYNIKVSELENRPDGSNNFDTVWSLHVCYEGRSCLWRLSLNAEHPCRLINDNRAACIFLFLFLFNRVVVNCIPINWLIYELQPCFLLHSRIVTHDSLVQIQTLQQRYQVGCSLSAMKCEGISLPIKPFLTRLFPHQ
jgi:hypothetical protein